MKRFAFVTSPLLLAIACGGSSNEGTLANAYHRTGRSVTELEAAPKTIDGQNGGLGTLRCSMSRDEVEALPGADSRLDDSGDGDVKFPASVAVLKNSEVIKMKAFSGFAGVTQKAIGVDSPVQDVTAQYPDASVFARDHWVHLTVDRDQWQARMVFNFRWPRGSQDKVSALVDGELQHELDDVVLHCN